jgi:hypothetical protein
MPRQLLDAFAALSAKDLLKIQATGGLWLASRNRADVETAIESFSGFFGGLGTPQPTQK